VLYTYYRYGWDQRRVGFLMAIMGVCSALVQGALVRPVVTRLGERRTLLCGLLCGAVGFLIHGLSPVGWLFLLGVPAVALWGLARPAMQGLMTRRIGPSEQGQLQGALSSVMGIAGLIGPALFTQIFAASISGAQGVHLPGAPYFVAAGLLLVGIGLAWRVTAAP
jgi:DHA1 family tetracycline resistance protein-like MFS transporter